MAKLQVEPFAARIGRNQHPRVLGEGLLGAGAPIQIHAAIEGDHGEATARQEVGQHGLGGHKLSEDQDLQGRCAFFLLELVDQVQHRFRLGVGARRLGVAGQCQQMLDFRPLPFPTAGLERPLHLRLPIQLGPVLGAVHIEQRALR